MNVKRLMESIFKSRRAAAARGKAFINVYMLSVHPPEMPDKCVARLHVLTQGDKGVEFIATDQVWAFDTMAETQRAVPRTCEWFGREITDDPIIAETWVDWATLPE